MAHIKINKHTPAAALKNKHLVVNCRTGEAFAADTHQEAVDLATEHEQETQNILIQEEEKARGNS